MSTQASSGTGIFAKLVAKFLVKWIKKTRDKNRAEQPALSATPSRLTGAGPERDRSHETYGAHTGSQGPRAAGAAPATHAVQGGDYGSHSGASGQRAPEAYQAPTAVTGGNFGEHRGTATTGVTRASDYTAGRRPSFTELVRQEIREALQRLAQAILRELGLSDRQLTQAGNGYVPSGQQLSPAGPGQWQMTPTSPESQLATNAHHTQTSGLTSGQTAQLQLPGGGRATVLILEVSQ